MNAAGAGPAPVVALSFIIELPHDLGLEEDSRIEILRHGPLYGWDRDALAHLPGWDGGTEGVHPVVALRFRRAVVGIGMPTEATDRCFGDIRRAAMTTRQRRAYERSLKRWVRRGMRVPKTVVRITCWRAASELEAARELDAWLRGVFREGFSVLNQWLSTYALASARLDHGPVSLADLPPAVPLAIQGKQRPGDHEVYGERPVPIHDAVPSLLGVEGDAEAAAAASHALIMDTNPFLEALKLLFGAQGHLASGRERQAVLDAGTGIEMLVSSILRAAGEERPSFDPSLAVRAPFRQRFEHHLPRALGDGMTLARDLNGARAAWWEHGYALRNAVVHEGAAADPSAAAKAVDSAWDLVAACGSLLRETEDTAPLGRLLQVVWHSE